MNSPSGKHDEMNGDPARRILVIAPHPDDEVLGCGGALARHADAGARISVVFLTSGELGLKHLLPTRARRLREREARAAGRILGVRHRAFLRGPDWGVGEAQRQLWRPLGRVLRREQPELIYLPHPEDGHPDHQAAWPLLRAAWLAGLTRQRRPLLRAYEVWSPLPHYDHVEDISQVMPRKLRALRAHASQLHEFDYVRAIRGLNQYRGALAARRPYVEVFQSIDWPG